MEFVKYSRVSRRLETELSLLQPVTAALTLRQIILTLTAMRRKTAKDRPRNGDFRARHRTGLRVHLGLFDDPSVSDLPPGCNVSL